MATTRDQIDSKYKWDFTAIYADQAAFEADYAKAQALVEGFGAHEATMCDSGEALYAMLSDETKVTRIISLLAQYAHLRSDVNKADNTYLALMGRVMKLAHDFGAVSAFAAPKVIRLDGETLEKWYKEYPPLEEYRRSIYKIQRYKPYTLSDECEKLLANLAEGMRSHSNIRGVFASADLKFGTIRDAEGKKVQLSDNTYTTFLMSPDRRVRRAAFTKLYETYAQFGNTFAALINAYAKESHANAKVAGYPSVLESTVYADEVTSDIYNNLIDTVNANLDTLFEYYDLKREMLGVSKLHLYDIYTPLIGSCTKEYSYEDAVQEVLDTVAIFGSEYHDTLEAGLKEKNWVDVYPTAGKTGGAYSSGSYDTDPYILMNFTGTIDSVSTLAHECGHSMHSYYSKVANTPQDSHYTIFVAEVASTVNELLFCHRKLKESDSKEEKLAILNQIMETYKGTLFRQTMFAEFERDFHNFCAQGRTLTQDLMNSYYYDLVKRYFGPRVVCDKQIAYEWMRIPHFYRSFYVYKYATCVSAASSIVKKLESGDQEYIARYLDFLRCGGAKSPLESLEVAGIDMTRPEVVSDAIADFAQAIKMFRELQNA